MRDSFQVIEGGAPQREPEQDYERDARLALEGDADATDRLWSRARAFLTRIGLALGVRPEDLPDVIQDTLWSAHENLARFDPEKGRFEAWLGTIFVRRARNQQRKESRLKNMLSRFLASSPAESQPPDQQDQESRWTLEALLAALTERERKVIALYEIADLSADECARILDISAAGVRSLARHARKKLARVAEHLESGKGGPS